jgi:uridine kinase
MEYPFQPKCDSFAFGPSALMDKLLEAYDFFLQSEVDPDVPLEIRFYEYILKHQINVVEKDIDYHYVMSRCNAIAIAGDSASGKTTLASRLKRHFTNSFVLECDRYHKWEREDENWKSFTHLHPEANYIAKMQEDVFDLKLGNKIYQVDYDHKVGRFTEPKVVNPSDNLIVVGLHAIAVASEELYDLSVFLEPHFMIRKSWKLLRDTTVRGRLIEDVLKQIDSRKADYSDYVEPQRNLADLVIGLYSIDTEGSEVTHLSFQTRSTQLAMILEETLMGVSAGAQSPILKSDGNKYLLQVYNTAILDHLKSKVKYPEGDIWDIVLYVVLSVASVRKRI